MINDLLFVYGSLLNADNEFANYLKNNATFYSTGRFKGRLFDIGEYPGTITGTSDDYYITGSIFRLTSAEALVILDDYEGFGQEQDQPNLFIRDLLPVETENGSLDCYVYLYNLSVDGLLEISSGEYINYLKQK
ncbi:gamma-glutamylcyclotransferase family protein [Mucilaginibacter sp. UYCu711]|uniref:gamma-glutamylcyclotransferase family protein n=1 Tax=Mucilaginibacter sp. UYCu711 TaxID=3156339 RepID=UPI003D1C9CA5